MYKFIFFSISILICFGCEDDDHTTALDIPHDIELDLDNDGDTDFNIAYLLRTEGDPVGNYQAIRMNLEAEDENQVLKNENQFPVFLDETNVIKVDVEAPFYWETTNPSPNTTTPIATIRTGYDEVTWNDEWMVFSLETKEIYIIGFKLLDDDNAKVGFIEFSVDLKTGQFNLLKTELL